MKACVLTSKKNIEFQDIVEPQLRNGEVLVAIKACGICSSDFNRVYGDGAYFFPLVLGHEFSGQVVKCSPSVDTSLMNKRVVVYPLLPCNECEFCKTKHYAQCIKYGYFGSRQNGAMAEFLAVPEWNLKVLPNDMPYEVAALCEPMAVAVNAINKITNIKNKEICISGSGTIAILCGLYAQSEGASVSFIVRSDPKKAFLKSFGFKNFVVQDSNGRPSHDVLVECVGTNDSLCNCVRYVKSTGQVVLVGNPASDMNLSRKDYWKILRSELTITGVWNSNYKSDNVDDWDTAIDFLYNYQRQVSNVITDKFRLPDGLAAFETMMRRDSIHIKGMFCNEE